jgi:predicted RNA-binding protein associated with RNAse of E/G family/RimJ/RimL family protein N-acetyltransferase
MKRKYIARSQWQIIKSSKCVLFNTYQERFNGYASAVFVEEVREKLVCRLPGREFCLVDDGYSWIQRLPVGKNWSVTTMFDDKNNIIQWYFDITKQNSIDENGQPFYDDLYLDVVVFPTGEAVLFDEDELKEALESGDITQSDFDLAVSEADKIINGMAKDIKYLTDMSFSDLEFFKAQLLINAMGRITRMTELKHEGTQAIETKRLLLRRFTIDDSEAVFEKWTGSAENSRFVMRYPHKTVAETKQMLSDYINDYNKTSFYMWGIVFEDELIGYICGNEINEEIRSICIGYCITKSCWNKGIATEAAIAVIRYFFSLGFNRVFSYHNPLNPASGKVMLKSGMKFEGRIRGGSLLAGEICDCMQYSILRSD